MILRGYIKLTGHGCMTGTLDVSAENSRSPKFVRAGGTLRLLVEHNTNTGHYTALLCLKHGDRNRSLKMKFQDLGVVDDPGSMVVAFMAGLDDRDLAQAVDYMLGDDDVTHLNWLIEASFKKGVNPLAFLRSVFAGEWKYVRGATSTQDCVTWDCRLIWTGRSDRPADASLN